MSTWAAADIILSGTLDVTKVSMHFRINTVGTEDGWKVLLIFSGLVLRTNLVQLPVQYSVRSTSIKETRVRH